MAPVEGTALRCAGHAGGPFCGLPAAILAACDRAKIPSSYARGQILYQEGNPALGVYCIQEGLVKVYRIGTGGKEHILRIAGPGDLLGYRAILAGSAHDHFAEAVSESRICFLSVDALRPLLHRSADFSALALRLLERELCETERRLLDASQRKADERLLLFLLDCGEKLAAAGGTRLEVPFTRVEIADYIGTAPETVIRGLRRLCRQKLIRVTRRVIEIPDPARLRRLLQR